MNLRTCRGALVIMFVIILNSIFCHAQKNGKLHITGAFSWLLKDERISLNMLEGSHGNYKELVLDSTVSKDGKFSLKYSVPNGPRLFFIYFKGHPTRFIHLFANNEVIELKDGDYAELPKLGYIDNYVRISGSSLTNTFISSIPMTSLPVYLEGGIQHYIQQIEDSVGYDRNLIEGALVVREKFFKTLMFVFEQLSSTNEYKAYIPYYYINYYRWIGKEPSAPTLYEKLDEHAKNSYYGKIMKENISSCIGQAAKDFSLVSNDGKSSTLKEVISKGKLTLLYFWSAEQTRGDAVLELLSQYRKYHDKGLNIVSICIDKDSVAWKKAIEKDFVPWYQTCDFKGKWDGIAKQYGYTTEVSPFVVLVDENGKIFNWLTSGAVLQLCLDKVFEK